MITEDLMARLMALPDKHTGPRERPWTKEEDDALWYAYEIKGHAATAKVLGRCAKKVRERYSLLEKERGGD